MLGVDMASLILGGLEVWAVCGACELSTTLICGGEGRSWTRVTE